MIFRNEVLNIITAFYNQIKRVFWENLDDIIHGIWYAYDL